MKKKQFFYTFAAGIFAAAILAGGLVSSPTLVSADEEPTAEATDASNNPQDNNASQLQTLLENEGFYVQQGSFYELDTLKEASAGRLLSCFGNNAGSSYMVFNLPAAPEQDTNIRSRHRIISPYVPISTKKTVSSRSSSRSANAPATMSPPI